MREMYRVAERWCRSLRLDTDILLGFVIHDWIHATFGVQLHEEGLAFAVQECLEAQLFDLDLFFDLAVELALDTDRITVERVEEVFCLLTAPM